MYQDLGRFYTIFGEFDLAQYHLQKAKEIFLRQKDSTEIVARIEYDYAHINFLQENF